MSVNRLLLFLACSMFLLVAGSNIDCYNTIKISRVFFISSYIMLSDFSVKQFSAGSGSYSIEMFYKSV